MEKDKLLKVLMLTTSEADGEALNAIRIANQLLKKNGLTWEDALFGKPQAKQQQSQQRPYEPRAQYRSTGDPFSDVRRAYEEMRREQEMAEMRRRQQAAGFAGFAGAGRFDDDLSEHIRRHQNERQNAANKAAYEEMLRKNKAAEEIHRKAQEMKEKAEQEKRNERDKLVEAMFDEVLANVQGSSREFIESLHEQYEKKGDLSPKQYRALEKFYNNIIEKEGRSW